MTSAEHNLSTARAGRPTGELASPAPLQDAGRFYVEAGPSKRALSTFSDNVFCAMNGQGIANLPAENSWEIFWVTTPPTDKLGMRIEGELGAPLRIPVNNLILARYEDAHAAAGPCSSVG